MLVQLNPRRCYVLHELIHCAGTHICALCIRKHTYAVKANLYQPKILIDGHHEVHHCLKHT